MKKIKLDSKKLKLNKIKIMALSLKSLEFVRGGLNADKAPHIYENGSNMDGDCGGPKTK